MFGIVRISQLDTEYVIDYMLDKKPGKLRIRAELAEQLKPHELFYCAWKLARDREIAGKKGKLVKEWN